MQKSQDFFGFLGVFQDSLPQCSVSSFQESTDLVFFPAEYLPLGLKPCTLFAAFSARLKPGPCKTLANSELSLASRVVPRKYAGKETEEQPRILRLPPPNGRTFGAPCAQNDSRSWDMNFRDWLLASSFSF